MAGRGPLNLAACRRRYRKQQRRYRRAVQDNNRRRIHQLENWLLKSHAAKVVAVAKAAQKKGYPLDAAKLDMTASALSCWEDPSKPAVLYFKKKKSGGVRPIIRSGVMRAAQQYLAVGMLEPRLWLHEGQYAVPGRDRTAAIEAAKQLMRDGYHCVIRGDIKDCYLSMDSKEILARMNALEEALWAAPVGDLQLKFCKMCRARQGFRFLEYYIFLDEIEGPIARPLMADFRKLDERLSAMGLGSGRSSTRTTTS